MDKSVQHLDKIVQARTKMSTKDKVVQNVSFMTIVSNVTINECQTHEKIRKIEKFLALSLLIRYTIGMAIGTLYLVCSMLTIGTMAKLMQIRHY